MRFGILGPFQVIDGDGHEVALGGRRQRAVLAILLLHAGELVSTDRLIDELWGERAPATAAKTVQVYISKLRKVLGDGALVTRAGGYMLHTEPDDVDWAQFQTLVAQGRAALQRGQPSTAAELLQTALALWRGPALADLVYEPFTHGEVVRLEEARMAAIEDRIDADLALGQAAALVGELEALVLEHPLRERLHGQWMLALYRAGRQIDALAAYRDLARRLRDELGLEPGESLQELERAILRHDPALIPTQKPAPSPTGRLPSPPTPFLGRARELAEVIALLQSPLTRLLTLTGAGGSGKTRLALKVAEECMASYDDGAWFVSFADVTDPRLIAQTICQTLGLDERRRRDPDRRLIEWLNGRGILLLLDNLEQLAAGTALLSELLAACPRLGLLVTSREPLHLAGEQQYDVPVLEPEDAIDLFTNRAKAVAPRVSVESALADRICERLDRLPLAIELAAARAKAFPPHEILARLETRLPLLTGGPRDAPRRQRTLRDTIDWSYKLLNAEEQRLFARLAVFAGGFTLAAAETVCAAKVDTLHALVDRSLVQSNGERYGILQTLREYALERLEQSGEADEIRHEHHRWFSALLDAEIREPDAREIPPPWPPSLTQERENMNAALIWALQQRGWRGTGRP